MDNIKFRAVIEYLLLKGYSAKEIKTELDDVYEDSSPSLATIYNWCNEFRRGRDSVLDEPRSGRPRDASSQENIDLVEHIVLRDRRLKLKEIAAESGLSKSTVHRIISMGLGMNKISARWIPKLLSSVEKARRVE